MKSAHLQLLKKIVLFSTVDEKSIQLIKDGLSNYNYHIEHNNKDYFVKIPDKGSSYLLNPEVACQHTLFAAELNITPKVIYFDKPSGILVQDYIHIKPLPLQIATIKQCALLLKKLHHSKCLFNESISYLEKLDDYLAKLSTTPYQFLAPIAAIKKQMSQLKHKKIPLVACHNDPVWSNFIHGDEQFFLVDWEYSSNGDAAWDLAYFMTYNQLTIQQQQCLIDTYQTDDDTLQSRITCYKPLTTFMFVILIELWIQDSWLPTDEKTLRQWQQQYLRLTRELLLETS